MNDSWRRRLSDKMAERDITPAQLTKLAGVGATMVHDILKRGVVPSISNLDKLANALGCRLVDLLQDSDTIPHAITPLGVLDGGDMWSESRSADVPLNFFFSDLVSIVIRTNDLKPAYKAGDTVSGPRSVGRNIDNLVGSDCIIETDDGKRLLRTLMRGSKPGRFTLRSLDQGHADIVDVSIKWAAPIRMILR